MTFFCSNTAQKEKTHFSSHTSNRQSKYLEQLFLSSLLLLPSSFFQSFELDLSQPMCALQSVKYGFTKTCDDLGSPVL